MIDVVVLPAFVTPHERLTLLTHLASIRHLSRFIGDGSMYQYIPDTHHRGALLTRALSALRFQPGDVYDCFFLHYRSGTCIPAHRDATPLRLNVLLTAATSGGEFRHASEPVPLIERDAVIFDGRERHEVTVVTGERVVWSVGIRSRRDP